MKTMAAKIVLIVLIFLTLTGVFIRPCAAGQGRKNVLILHSYHKADWTDNLLRGIQSVLGEMPDVDMAVEYMDTKRIKNEEYYRTLDHVYRLKYGANQFDVVLTSDDNAYRYALERQATLFHNTPIVFCGVNRFDPREIADKPLVTGVVEEGDFEETLQYALRVRLKAAAIHVILDHTRTAEINKASLLEVLKRHYPRLKVRYLADLSLADLGASLAALPPDDFAFFISFWQDNKGTPVTPDNLSNAFQQSSVPIFGRSEWMMGRGQCGGKCVSGFNQGQAAAQMVKRILDGENVADIPVNRNSPNQFMFDYKLLVRYGIDPATVPKDSILFNNPPPGIYEQHRQLIWSTITILLVLMALVFFLGLNIVSRRRMEKALSDSEARYRQLVQYAPAGILELDTQRQRFISVNDVMCQYTGYTEAEFLDLDLFSLLTEDSIPEYTRLLDNARPDTPSPPAVEFRIKAKSGRVFWVLVNYRFTFENDLPKAAMAVVHDLTVLRRTEEEKRRLEAKLTQIQKIESLGTLAGGIAHDFNNLMMGIQGNASLMLIEADRNKDDVDRLKNIENHVRRGADLTRQLLGLTHGGKYEVKPTDINRLVTDSAAMFGRTRKDIRIHRKLSQDVWTVECDRGQLDQVLLNIFVNAWQAMPGGGDLYIMTENTVLDDAFVRPHEVPPGKYVKISVRDTGIGMDDHVMTKIFDPFFTTKERERGTGLGLASAFGIIRNHDGIIDVSSRVGEGTTFNLYLPAVEKAVTDEAQPSVEDRILSGSERILLVDDENMVRDVGKLLLEKLGYRVFTAASGAEAIEVYRSHHDGIDLVVLDMIMPGMSGAETFTQIQKINADACVLLSSGYSIDGTATEILNNGCRGFIQKPFNINELSHKVREVLNK